MLRPAEWSFSSQRNSSISNAATTVSMRQVAFMVPLGKFRNSCETTKISFHSRASRCDSIFGR